MSALLPCPFCGESGQVMITTQGGSLKALCACGATGPPDGEGPEGNEVGPASAQWNRRAHLATETAAIQKVRDEMAAMKLMVQASIYYGRNEGAHKWRAALEVTDVNLDREIAALDEILGRRK